MARKTFNEEVVETKQSSYTEEQIAELLKEVESLKKQNLINNDNDRTGKELVGYVIVLSRFNNKFHTKEQISFGVNGKIYNVKFGEPTEVPMSIVENIKNHIEANTVTDPISKITTNNNVHYQFNIIREVWR